METRCFLQLDDGYKKGRDVKVDSHKTTVLRFNFSNQNDCNKVLIRKFR